MLITTAADRQCLCPIAAIPKANIFNGKSTLTDGTISGANRTLVCLAD